MGVRDKPESAFAGDRNRRSVGAEIHNKAMFGLIYIIFLFILERFSKQFHIPTNLQEKSIIRWANNFTMGLINRIILPLFTLPILIWATQIHLYTRPDIISSKLSTILDIFVLDFTGYIFHRLCHSCKFLWKFHEIHHSDFWFDVTTGLRIHFFELFIANIYRSVVVIIFSMNLNSVLVFELLLLLVNSFHHTNIKIPKILNNILGTFIVTPERHAVHHHADYKNSNSNFGFILIWWDMLCNTYNTVKRTESWRMGLYYVDEINLKDMVILPFKKVLNIKSRVQNSYNKGI